MTEPAGSGRDLPGHAARTVTVNTLAAAGANVANKVLMFAFYIIAARHLGVGEYGVLSGALAFVTMFSVLTDLGLGNITAREIARDRAVAPQYVGNSLAMVGLATIAVVGLIVVLVNVLHYPARSAHAVYVLCVLVVAGAFTAYFAYVFLGLERMYLTATAQLLQTVMMVVGGLVLVRGPASATRYAALYAVVSTAVAAFVAVVATRYVGWVRPRFRLAQWTPLLRTSLPVGAAVAMVSIYYWNGHAILQRVHGDAAVGVLNAAFRLVMGACFAGMALSAALYPLFSRYYVTDSARLAGVFRAGLRYASMWALPVAALTIPLARPVVVLVYGPEYAASAAVLRVLVWWGAAAIYSSMLSNYVLAANRAALVTLQCLVSLAVNVTLNVLLIPRFGAMGAAVALVAAEVSGVALLLVLLRRIGLTADIRAQVSAMLRIGASVVPAASVAVLLSRFESTVGRIAALVGAVLAYCGVLLATRTLTRDDTRFVRSLFKRPGD